MQRGAPTLPSIPVAIILVLSAIGCFFLYELVSRAITDRFPALEPGWYEGRIAGKVVAAVRPIPIAVDVAEDGKRLRIVTLATPPLAQNLVVNPTMATRESGPLVLELKDARAQTPPQDGSYRLKLTGKRTRDGRYSGVIENLMNGQSGEWELRRLSAPGANSGTESPSGVGSPAGTHQAIEARDWLQLRSQLEDLRERYNFLLHDIDIIHSEIDRLSEFVSQSSELRDKAKQERQLLSKELAELATSRAKNEVELERLTQQIRLRVKYSTLGRIVALSDNILEREVRWLEAALLRREATSDGKTPEDLMVQRGKEVIKLREQISQLEQKLELRNQSTTATTDQADYWRDLQ